MLGLPYLLPSTRAAFPSIPSRSSFFRLRTMSTQAPAFLGFHLALVQLGRIGPDKGENLRHAKYMIARAASGDGGRNSKPDLIVLPVSRRQSYSSNTCLTELVLVSRNASTRPMVICTFLFTPKLSTTHLGKNTTSQKLKAGVSEHSQRPHRLTESGSLEVHRAFSAT